MTQIGAAIGYVQQSQYSSIANSPFAPSEPTMPPMPSPSLPKPVNLNQSQGQTKYQSKIAPSDDDFNSFNETLIRKMP